MQTEKESLKIRTRNMIELDQDVKRWVSNLNSDSAKRIYSEALLKFSEYSKLSPKEIVDKCRIDKKQVEDLLTDFIQDLRPKHTPKVVHNNLVGVKSWLLHNDLEIRRKINCGNVKSAPNAENESVPTQDELDKILRYSDLRGRAFISLIAFAGLRPSTAVSIKLRDIPDLIINGTHIDFSRVPVQIKVQSQFSKNKKPYFTFLSAEGCDYILDYLRFRANKGNEVLTKESPIIMYSVKSTRYSINRKGFSKKIKRTFLKAGYVGRPYVLRSYFDTAMLNSGISPIYQQFLMGHSGSIEATYTLNKNLPQSQIDEMREQFREKVEPKLETIPAKTRNEIDLLKGENKQLQKQLEQLKDTLFPFAKLLEGLRQDEIMQFVRHKLTSEEKNELEKQINHKK